MTPEESDRESFAWRDRWPVAGPLLGAGCTVAIAIVGGTEGDWFDASLYAALAGVLGAFAVRNSARNARELDSLELAAHATPDSRTTAGNPEHLPPRRQ